MILHAKCALRSLSARSNAAVPGQNPNPPTTRANLPAWRTGPHAPQPDVFPPEITADEKIWRTATLPGQKNQVGEQSDSPASSPARVRSESRADPNGLFERSGKRKSSPATALLPAEGRENRAVAGRSAGVPAWLDIGRMGNATLKLQRLHLAAASPVAGDIVSHGGPDPSDDQCSPGCVGRRW